MYFLGNVAALVAPSIPLLYLSSRPEVETSTPVPTCSTWHSKAPPAPS